MQILIFSSFWVYVFYVISKKIKLLDRPDLYPDIKWTRKPVPTLQWVFLFLIFLLNLIVFFPNLLLEPQMLLFIFGSSILVLIWYLDDVVIWVRIKSLYRLLIQILVSAFVVYFANLQITELNLWFIDIKFDLFRGTLLSVIWFVLCINAINWFDWINAQASWVSTIWFLSIILLIKYVVLNYYDWISSFKLEILNSNLIALSILFVLWLLYTFLEWKPLALIRDAWTLFFGFALAFFSLSWWAKIWTLVVVLSLVIFDAIWVVFHRIFVLKKKPWQWDFTHLHHRLLALWWTKKEINIFVWTWSLIMMILMLLQWSNKFAKIVIFCMMLIVFFGVNSYLFWIKKIPCWLKKSKKT